MTPGPTPGWFVYGTLTDPDRAAAVLEGAVEFGPDATLSGMGLAEGRYPTLVADPDGEVEGRILRTDRAGALDRYEGVDGGLYVRVSISVADGDSGGEGTRVDGPDRGRVGTYVGDSDRLGVDPPAAWPGTGDLAERVRAYLDREAVVVRPEG